MSEIASTSSSSISHSLRIALHLWIPEPEHRILLSREGSMSVYAAWGGGGMPALVWSVDGKCSSRILEMEAVVSWPSKDLARHAVSWGHEYFYAPFSVLSSSCVMPVGSGFPLSSSGASLARKSPAVVTSSSVLSCQVLNLYPMLFITSATCWSC